MTIASLNYQAPAFKGMSRTESGTPYHMGHAGLIAGSVLAIDPAMNAIRNQSKSKELFNPESEVYKELVRDLEKGMSKKVEEFMAFLKKAYKFAIPITLATIATYIGCGAIVDNLRNKHTKEAAEQIEQFGVENAMRINHNIRFTDANTPYYKSNDGGKNGALLGLGAGVITGTLGMLAGGGKLIGSVSKQIPQLKNSKALLCSVAVLAMLPVYTLGGWIMGKITDHFNNKSARNASMEQYRQQAVYMS